MTDCSSWSYRDGELALTGEIYRPAGQGNGNAVLVVHEADGIGGNVRRHSQMLADLGYIAAAVDMHGKGRPLTGEEMMPALTKFKDDPAYLRRRIGAAHEALKTEFGLGDHQIAATGYCFGGLTVLELARSGAAVAGVASFHGLLTTAAPAERGAIRCRILACTGARDPLVPLNDVTAFQHEMVEADCDWQLAVFGRALHSFTNVTVDDLGDERMGYDDEAEVASWDMLRLFLERSFRTAAR